MDTARPDEQLGRIPDDEPVCAAAVYAEDEIAWTGMRGFADIEPVTGRDILDAISDVHRPDVEPGTRSSGSWSDSVLQALLVVRPAERVSAAVLCNHVGHDPFETARSLHDA